MNIIDPFRLITNFVKETKKYINEGRPQVTPEQYQDRLDICDSCDFLRKTTFTCGVCGCYLGTKAKWATSDCPKNKWLEVYFSKEDDDKK